MTETCALDYCDRPPRSGSEPLCEGHYYQRRRGRPFTPLQERGFTECSIEGCDRPPRGRYCPMHYTRIRRHSDPDAFTPHSERDFPRGELSPAWNAEGSYWAVHQRLRRERGVASSYACSCGAPARQWAFIGERGPGERMPWSTDLSLYEPMCVPCHKAHDISALARGTL